MDLKELAKHIRKLDFCMLSTCAGDGRITARPMSNNGDVDYDGDSWFFSYAYTGKIAAIKADPAVSLTFTAPPHLLGKPGIFIAIDGKAIIIDDRSQFEAHWVKGLERWFPQGTKTPELVLLKISAKSIHYWDGEEQGTVELSGDQRKDAI
jgi:general stress protein 26